MAEYIMGVDFAKKGSKDNSAHVLTMMRPGGEIVVLHDGLGAGGFVAECSSSPGAPHFVVTCPGCLLYIEQGDKLTVVGEA